MLNLISRIDLMVRVLLIAMLLAFVIPATGDGREVARIVTDGAIFLLFLLNGLRIDRSDIAHGARNVRFLLPVMLFVFGAMALAGWGLAIALNPWLPPLVALGFIYLGVLPSTVQSAASYTAIANGNIALSVIAAALINIAGVFVSAPLFALIAGAEQADVGLEAITRIGLILILPFVIGQMAQGITRSWIVDHRESLVWVDRLVIGLAVYVSFSGAVEQDIMSRVGLTDWAILLCGLVALLAFGNFGAWLASGALRLQYSDRIAFLFAGSQKSVAIGAPLGLILFAPEEAGFVLLPLLLYHLMQLMLAAPLATRLARAG